MHIPIVNNLHHWLRGGSCRTAIGLHLIHFSFSCRFGKPVGHHKPGLRILIKDYLLMRVLRVEHNVAAPGALIGASNFFELAVAVAITLFGADSPAALATVVGVLVEVPVMLSVCNACNRTRGWYQRPVGMPG